jgi:hypothetical protein
MKPAAILRFSQKDATQNLAQQPISLGVKELVHSQEQTILSA